MEMHLPENQSISVKLWGTRGSIPVANNLEQQQHKLTEILQRATHIPLDTPGQIETFIQSLPFHLAASYGGNSSCIQICHSGDEYMLCDFGTGIRDFANKGIKHKRQANVFHVFLSHLHWDHIMGFPFFNPAYVAGNIVHIYSCHNQAEQSFRAQHASPNFPIDFAQLKANIHFHTLTPGQNYQINGFEVRCKKQQHKDDSYGYRFEKQGKIVVYSTDSEHKSYDIEETESFVAFFRDADLVVFDAMYSLIDAITLKEDWGHSSNLTGVELCQRARAKHLCLFHHDPIHNDRQIEDTLIQARQFEQLTRTDDRLTISAAYDGQHITL